MHGYNFPDADELLNPEADLGALGYSRLNVSVFNGWLTRAEYEAIFPLTEVQIADFTSRRIAFFQKLKGLKYQHLDGYFLLKEKQYIKKTKSLFTGKSQIDFYMPEYELLVESGHEQVDFFYYKDINLIQPLIEKARESGLFVFP